MKTEPLRGAAQFCYNRCVVSGWEFAAGNEGEEGMHLPGGYAPVIPAGPAGWIGEWLKPAYAVSAGNRDHMWWWQYPSAPVLPGAGDVVDPAAVATFIFLTSAVAPLPDRNWLFAWHPRLVMTDSRVSRIMGIRIGASFMSVVVLTLSLTGWFLEILSNLSALSLFLVPYFGHMHD